MPTPASENDHVALDIQLMDKVAQSAVSTMLRNKHHETSVVEAARAMVRGAIHAYKDVLGTHSGDGRNSLYHVLSTELRAEIDKVMV